MITLAVLITVLYFAIRQPPIKRFDASQKPPAPNFWLINVDGQAVTLDAYRGKVVLLNFWATWCEPCRKEIPRFIEFQNQYGPRGLQVIGISLDDDSKPVYKFRDEFKVNYPIAMGNAKLAESYGGVLGLPISFVIDPQGHIIAKHIGAVDLSKIEQEIQQSLRSSGALLARPDAVYQEGKSGTTAAQASGAMIGSSVGSRRAAAPARRLASALCSRDTWEIEKPRERASFRHTQFRL